MNTRNLRVLVEYAKQKAKADTNNAANNDNDDDMQMVRDIQKDFIIGYANEKAILQSLDNPKITIAISDSADISVRYNGKEVDILDPCINDDVYISQEVVRHFQRLEKAIDQQKGLEINIEQSKIK